MLDCVPHSNIAAYYAINSVFAFIRSDIYIELGANGQFQGNFRAVFEQFQAQNGSRTVPERF